MILTLIFYYSNFRSKMSKISLVFSISCQNQKILTFLDQIPNLNSQLHFEHYICSAVGTTVPVLCDRTYRYVNNTLLLEQLNTIVKVSSRPGTWFDKEKMAAVLFNKLKKHDSDKILSQKCVGFIKNSLVQSWLCFSER